MKYISLSLILLFVINLHSQPVDQIEKLRSLSILMQQASDDKSKLSFSDQLELQLKEILEMPQSANFKLDSVGYLKVLQSEDKQVRIATWSLKMEDGSFQFRGFVHVIDSKTNHNALIRLQDQTPYSTPILNKSLTSSKWMGAVYFEMIEKVYSGKKYYTLLGWKGMDMTRQSKVVEVMNLKNNSEVVFGANIFNLKGSSQYKDMTNPKRVVFIYNSQTRMLLQYDLQTLVIREKKKQSQSPSKSKKPGFEAQIGPAASKEKTTTIKDHMIVMDRLVPLSPDMTDFYEFYYPEANVMDALRFEKNTWKLYLDIDARNEEVPGQKQNSKKSVNYDLFPSE